MALTFFITIADEQIEKNNFNVALANSNSIELTDQMELVSAKSPSENDKGATQEDFTRQAMDYRRKFYAFHRILESVAPRINEFAKEMKQHLIVKIPRILDHQALADHFERQLYKLAKNPKQTKKNWSEEETILLVSLIAYYCYIHNRDFNGLVITLLRTYSSTLPSNIRLFRAKYISFQRKSAI